MNPVDYLAAVLPRMHAVGVALHATDNAPPRAEAVDLTAVGGEQNTGREVK